MSADNAMMGNGPLLTHMRRAWIFLILLGFGLGMAGVWLLQPTPEPAATSITLAPLERSDKPRRLSTHTVANLEAKFSRLGYDLAQVREAGVDVPRIWADSVPGDMDRIQLVEKRKALFLKMMLPLVLIANEKIAEERSRVLKLKAMIDAGESLRQSDQHWLERMYSRYKVKAKAKNRLARLLVHVDEVPPSLALAQAAIESGWGTSRFAREGNALFGEWTWGDTAGIVPEKREEGKTHKIRAFPSPLASVESYLGNLNSHRAYRKFRKMRAGMRNGGQDLDGARLATTLTAYSEKGQEYVDLLHLIMRANELHPLDNVRLVNRGSAPDRA